MAVRKQYLLLKQITPPILISLLGKLVKKPRIDETKLGIGWHGNYTNWREANAKSTGYDNKVILDKCRNALLKIKKGEARYERDSVLFDEIEYSWGLLAGLQKAALENDGKLRVLDFGGSLGSTYYQNRDFLSSLKELGWYIVEQPHFVDCGKEFFENDQLKFYFTIEECTEKHKPDVLLISGVLQYLEKPFEWIDKLSRLDIPYIILDRTSFIENETDILTIQNVPENIYHASYPAWFFNYQKFEERFKHSYDIFLCFDDFFTGKITVADKICYWKGMILKSKCQS